MKYWKSLTTPLIIRTPREGQGPNTGILTNLSLLESQNHFIKKHSQVEKRSEWAEIIHRGTHDWRF